jgi:hypothetical protein
LAALPPDRRNDALEQFDNFEAELNSTERSPSKLKAFAMSIAIVARIPAVINSLLDVLQKLGVDASDLHKIL